MQDTHDERRIPLEYEPDVSASQRSYWQTMRELSLGRRNRQDAHRAKAVERNQADRRADALRQLRQPGLTEAERAAALRVLATVGTAQSEARGALPVTNPPCWRPRVIPEDRL